MSVRNSESKAVKEREKGRERDREEERKQERCFKVHDASSAKSTKGVEKIILENSLSLIHI